MKSAKQHPTEGNTPQQAVTIPATFTFHEDGGHGWLEVPFELLVSFGIEKEITGYSYRDGNTCYLEEDLDFGTFVKAYLASIGKPFDSPSIDQHWHNKCVNTYNGNYSFIRYLQHYYF